MFRHSRTIRRRIDTPCRWTVRQRSAADCSIGCTMMANCLQQSICGETAVMAMELHRRSSGGDPSIGKSSRDDGSTEYSNERVQPTSGGRLNGSAERPLKFSIDNILRPEFGGGSASGCSPPTAAVLNRYNHHYHHQHHQHLQQQQHLHNIDRLNHLNYQLHHLSQLSHNAAATAAVATVTVKESAATAAVASSSSDHDKSVSSRRSSSSSTAEPPSSPIDLSCSDSQTCLNPAAIATNSNSSTTTTATTTTSSTSVDAAINAVADKDVGGSQQWPAWVYCTRYSDRPSSGKS